MNRSSQLSNPRLWAVIPAAGSGKRFSAHHLKQYQPLGSKTVLEHSIQRLCGLPLSGYVLCIAEQDHYIHQLTLPQQEIAHFCLGGAERVNSVLNGLYYLKHQQLAQEDDWVLVHDAARPCVHQDSLQQLYQTAISTGQSAILAIPVRDTLKKATIHQSIEKTVDREQLWQAQTPQIAKLSILIQAIEYALTHQITITDEASALEHYGETVHLVTGRADNLKITYPEDLVLAQLILGVS